MVNRQFFSHFLAADRCLIINAANLIWSAAAGQWTMDKPTMDDNGHGIRDMVGHVLCNAAVIAVTSCHLSAPPALRPTVSCWPKCAQELPNKFFCYLIVTKLFPHALATSLFRLRFGHWSAAFKQGAGRHFDYISWEGGRGRGQRGKFGAVRRSLSRSVYKISLLMSDFQHCNS